MDRIVTLASALPSDLTPTERGTLALDLCRILQGVPSHEGALDVLAALVDAHGRALDPVIASATIALEIGGCDHKTLSVLRSHRMAR